VAKYAATRKTKSRNSAYRGDLRARSQINASDHLENAQHRHEDIVSLPVAQRTRSRTTGFADFGEADLP
jgi:hypothetical protein